MRRAAGAMAAAMVLAGCGGRAAPKTGKDSCREVARAGERWIAAATEPERADALAFAVEQIDLCQAPGLGRALAQCLAAATTVAAATSCPGISSVNRGALAPRHPHGSSGSAADDEDDSESEDEVEVIDPF